MAHDWFYYCYQNGYCNNNIEWKYETKRKEAKKNKELIQQISTHISLWKLNRYENTQSNLSGEWWIMEYYCVINKEKEKEKEKESK